MPATPVHPPAYRRREPEKEPLYQVLSGHLETFLQHTRTSEHQLPLHVEKEMRAYLECGILAYGFVRARCEDCGASRAVAFSCKKRGFCPSCSGRRMADTAARLVDGVYVDGDEDPVFVAAPPLSDQAVQQIVETSAPHHPPVQETRAARRHRSRSARRRGARAGGSHRGFGTRAHRYRGPRRPAFATGPERSGHRGAYGALVLRLARLFAACGDADRGP